MYNLTTEKDADYWEVEALFDLCFAPGREALSSYRYRDGIQPITELCLVARDDTGTIGGAIRYWPVQIAGAAALLLGPVAVHPTRAGEGLGGVLIRDSLDIARNGACLQDIETAGPFAAGDMPAREKHTGKLRLAQVWSQAWSRVLLVGDAPYYERFGFAQLPDIIMAPPTNPERVLGLDIMPGGWAGIKGVVQRFDPAAADKAKGRAF